MLRRVEYGRVVLREIEVSSRSADPHPVRGRSSGLPARRSPPPARRGRGHHYEPECLHSDKAYDVLNCGKGA